MRVLITGATGLVGSEIVRLCHERNIYVNYLTTRSEKVVSRENYQGFLWKPDRGEIDLQCFKDVTAIINLAGSTISKRWTPRNRNRIIRSRVNSLRTLHDGLQKIDASQIVSLVSASAIGVYPHSFDSYYVETEKQVDDSFLGEVVQVWENEVDAFKKFDLKVSKVRIGLVMSLKGGALPEMAKPIKNYVGAPIGSGEQWQSWIHISDLARIFLYVVENELKGVYNGVGPNPVSNMKLVKEIAKVLDKPLLIPKIPKIVLKILLGKMSYLLLASQRVSSKKIEEEGFVFEYQNICRALEEIYRNEAAALSNSVGTKEYIS
ncbi:TIGR01777 family oxidoreductase [uncultured Kriegella sp.]|uniref:TIGR01777 family oxidoreductase n=1 Tax=uncultured Kriegella sp. TaxID=1798910 RepID=UPI0030DCD39B|tara:strand:+ start:74621 stop:75580 length:960 start_codon:yes stop_codon:yes gene_type:complete